ESPVLILSERLLTLASKILHLCQEAFTSNEKYFPLILKHSLMHQSFALVREQSFRKKNTSPCSETHHLALKLHQLALTLIHLSLSFAYHQGEPQLLHFHRLLLHLFD